MGEGNTEDETSTSDGGGDEGGEEGRETGEEVGQGLVGVGEGGEELDVRETGKDVVRETGREDVAAEGGSVRACGERNRE